VSEDASTDKVEVWVGHIGRGKKLIGEKVRFRGRQLGSSADPDSLSEPSRRKTTFCTLYECPEGYRVYRQEVPFYPQKKRYRHEFGKEGHSASLLPSVSKKRGEGHEGETLHFGLYTEEEARRAFPWLFSELGMHKVRDLD
jgi:hypothetical protein